MTIMVVTGIGGRLAQMVAGALAGRPGVRVLGVDRIPVDSPPLNVPTFVSNMRGQALCDWLHNSGAEVVVHLSQYGEERLAPGREAAVRGNVITSMELLGACAAAGVRRVVLRSSSWVYGARHDIPAFVDESAPLLGPTRPSLTRDYVEIERFAAEFAQKRPSMSIAVLRCAGLIGAGVSSPLGRYLAQPAPRTVLGFDPRIQLLHTDDAVTAFALAALADDQQGALNIAAADPITLSQAILLAGHRPLPLPASAFDIADTFGGRMAEFVGLLPADANFLRFTCVADTSRAHSQLGWQPLFGATEMLRELAAQGGG